MSARRGTLALGAATLGALLLALGLWLRAPDAAREPVSVLAAQAHAGEELPHEPELLEPRLLESEGERARLDSLEPPEDTASRSPPGRVAEYDELRADEAVLQVRVVSLEGRPVSAVPVRVETAHGEVVPLRLYGTRHGAVTHEGARSDLHGRLDLAVPAGVELVVCANFALPALGPRGSQLERPLEPRAFRTCLVPIVERPELFWCGNVVDVDSGAPIPELQVEIQGQTFRSVDPSGFLELGVEAAVDPASRSWDVESARAFLERGAKPARAVGVRLSSPGYAPRLVQIGPGHERRELAERIELGRVSSLEVWVEASEPLDSAITVEVVAREGGLERTGVPAIELEEHGCYRFEGLPPWEDFAAVIRQGDSLLAHARLQPRLGTRENRRLVLRVGELGSIGGTVRNSAGDPVQKLDVRLTLEEDWFRSIWQTTTDTEGRFRFPLLPEGDYVLHEVGRAIDGGLPFRIPPERQEFTFSPVSLRLGGGESIDDLALAAWPGVEGLGAAPR